MSGKPRKPPTYEDLEAINLALRRELIALQDANRADREMVNATIDFRVKALTFAEAFHGHPWTNQKVYDAGMDLIKAVREAKP